MATKWKGLARKSLPQRREKIDREASQELERLATAPCAKHVP